MRYRYQLGVLGVCVFLGNSKIGFTLGRDSLVP